MSDSRHLAVLVASLANGGIGKMRVHLINEFVRSGVEVDLLVADTASRYMTLLSPEVKVFPLKTSHAWTSVPAIARYLRQRRPEVMLTQRIRVNVAALRARTLARAGARIFATLNTNLSKQLESMPARKRMRQIEQLRKYYPRNDGLIAVSRGVAEDAASLIGCPLERIQPIPNPVVTPELTALAAQPADHPWFTDGQPPVVLAVGRLEPQKDFDTLLRAFALARDRRPDVRLVILGEGKLRGRLIALAEELGMAQAVDMPGFVDNPYAFMSRADLFVLSSAWEGSGNALTEAAALGRPVVSTDCPSGPREILQDGRYGRLVPVGDPAALAEAILNTLAEPLPSAFLREAGERYTVANSARRYLAAMRYA